MANEKLKSILEKYEAGYLFELTRHCINYTTIGSSYLENPMWFIYEQTLFYINRMRFVSSQKSDIYFYVDIMPQDAGIIDANYDDVSLHFRSIKYEYIKSTWPKVYYEIKPDEKPVGPPVEIVEPVINIPPPADKDEPSEYDIQAEEFLAKTGTSISTEFVEFGYHFAGDKQKRNIFDVTLANDRHSYTFKFGQSIASSLENPNDTFIDDPVEFYCGFKFENLKRPYLSYSEKIGLAKLKVAWDKRNWWYLLSKEKATKAYHDFTKAYHDFIAANTSKWKKINFKLDEWLQRIEYAIVRKAGELHAKNWGVGIEKAVKEPPSAYSVLAAITKYDPGTHENFCGDYGYDIDSRAGEKIYHAVVEEWENVNKLFTEDELELLSEIN